MILFDSLGNKMDICNGQSTIWSHIRPLRIQVRWQMDHELVATHPAISTKCSDCVLMTDLNSMKRIIWYSFSYSRNYLSFIRPKSSLVCLQGFDIDFCLQWTSENLVYTFLQFLILSPTIHLGLKSGLIPLGIPTKIAYAFIMSLTCITCAVYPRYTRFRYLCFRVSAVLFQLHEKHQWPILGDTRIFCELPKDSILRPYSHESSSLACKLHYISW
jgi:hypothetical protein